MAINSKNKGYTLVEMVIYVTLMSVVSLLIINTVLSFTSSYKNVLALRAVDSSALDALERMSRDIRGATSIDTGNSTFGSNPGVLTLLQTSSSSGTATTTKFYLQQGVLKVDVNGTYIGPFTSRGSSVSSLVFTRLDSGISTGIKIDLTLVGVAGSSSRTKTYHTTIMLKSF